MAVSKRLKKLEEIKFKRFQKRLVLIKKDKAPQFGETKKEFKERTKLTKILRKQRMKTPKRKTRKRTTRRKR